MHAPERLEVGQSLIVKFYYSVSEIDCVQALTEVVRVDRLGKSEKDYRCAVRFVELSSDSMEKLSKFLKSLY